MIVLTFHPRIRFYKEMKTLLPAIFLTESLFMVWNVCFEKMGIWGFNAHLLCGSSLFGIPLEEWMLFFIFPYTCIFLLNYLQLSLPLQWSKKVDYFLVILLLLFCIVGCVFFHSKIYTFTILLLTAIVNAVVFFGYTPKWYRHFILAFLVFYSAFFVLNGVASYYITGPIVWYRTSAIVNLKFLELPLENCLFYFNLFLVNVVIYSRFRKKTQKGTLR